MAYWTRLVEPYAAALPKADVTEAPHLFAIPGNHDWYDGLMSFMRLFGQKRTLGAWKTFQSRSYFALKLPHGFWLLGVDIQLESDIDQPQIEYFCKLATHHMRDGDRVILCTAEPDWVKGAIYNPELQSNLAFFEKQLADARPGVEIVARIAGDLHHYRRHESTDGRQNVIAGGGGAFLHPTHGEPVTVVRSGAGTDQRPYTLRASFPSESESRRLAWRKPLVRLAQPRLLACRRLRLHALLADAAPVPGRGPWGGSSSSCSCSSSSRTPTGPGIAGSRARSMRSRTSRRRWGSRTSAARCSVSTSRTSCPCGASSA